MSTRTHLSRVSASLAIATGVALASTVVSAADFPAGTYTSQGFTLAFDGGHFRGTQKDAIKVEGDYAANGDQLQFTDTSGPWACPAGQKGSYRWKTEGTTLTFSKVADPCKDRVQSLTPHPWTKD